MELFKLINIYTDLRGILIKNNELNEIYIPVKILENRDNMRYHDLCVPGQFTYTQNATYELKMFRAQYKQYCPSWDKYVIYSFDTINSYIKKGVFSLICLDGIDVKEKGNDVMLELKTNWDDITIEDVDNDIEKVRKFDNELVDAIIDAKKEGNAKLCSWLKDALKFRIKEVKDYNLHMYVSHDDYELLKEVL